MKPDVGRHPSALFAEITWIMSPSSMGSILVTCSAAIKNTTHEVRPLKKDAPILRDAQRIGCMLRCQSTTGTSEFEFATQTPAVVNRPRPDR